MQPYTEAMLKIIGVPRLVNLQGKKVEPPILFSPAFAEPILFWHASSLSYRLHDVNALGIELVADESAVSGVRLSNVEQEQITDNPSGIGVAAGLMLVSAAGDEIIAPARKHKNFDFENVIISFRNEIRKRYDNGQSISPDDHSLNSVFYDRITCAYRSDKLDYQSLERPPKKGF